MNNSIPFSLVGLGGFGEIYLTSDNIVDPVGDDAKCVVKVEPHSNGPLFAEMHCYMRIARPEYIETWKRDYKLDRFGMPKYLGSGSFQYQGNRYRFIITERFGLNLQQIIEQQHDKRFSFETVYQVGIQIVSVHFFFGRFFFSFYKMDYHYGYLFPAGCVGVHP